MSRIILPYNLRDGQRAYAARIMADLEALAGKLNGVHLQGLGDCDIETALQQLKMLMDAEYAADAKVLHDIGYDDLTHRLRLTLRDGAVLELDMAPFLQPPLGSNGQQVTVSVSPEGRISAALTEGCISADELAPALAELINGQITAGEPGNASQILFADGQSFEQKLQSGQLKGTDGVSVSLDGMYYLRYDETDGHLYLGVAEEAERPPLSINEAGHLIYTIE